jgi:hypothetical protein
METLGDKNQPEFSQNSANKYYCKYCDYGTSKKCNYDTHIISSKHTKKTYDYKKRQNSAIIQPEFSQDIFMCYCGKEYQHRQGLWRHNKKCNINEPNKPTESETKQVCEMEIINMLIKEQSDIKELILQIVKKDTYNNSNNTTNSHNKTFNLQFFLNETCKDAMNIMDFVDSIQLQLSDLENVGKIGYVEGISNIIVKNLKALDVTQRPIHCADKKREVMYVKDQDKWEKEDEQNKKIKRAIKRVAFKNQNLIQNFKEAHPDCNTYHSRFSDQYNKIIVESMGGSGDNDLEKEAKIITNISKNVTIDKEY